MMNQNHVSVISNLIFHLVQTHSHTLKIIAIKKLCDTASIKCLRWDKLKQSCNNFARFDLFHCWKNELERLKTKYHGKVILRDCSCFNLPRTPWFNKTSIAWLSIIVSDYFDKYTGFLDNFECHCLRIQIEQYLPIY